MTERFPTQLFALALWGILAWPVEPAAGGEPAVVFVSREIDSPPDPSKRLNAVERARSGRLLLLEASGRLRVLVDASLPGTSPDTPLDALDPDVSYDGKSIVFSGYSRDEGAFRIYEVGVDGSGLHQITGSDRRADLSRHGPAAESLEGYDDLDPCYLPDGRICFVSTRYPGIAPDGRARATNLYVVNRDGSDLHRITTERFGADTPVVEPSTGRIVYSRWWRTPQVSVGSVGDFAPPSSTVDVEKVPPPPREKPPPREVPPPPIPPGSPGYGGAGQVVQNDKPRPQHNDPSEPSEAGVQTTPQKVLNGISDGEFPGVNSWFLTGINPDGTAMSMYSGFRLDRELTQAYRPSFLPDGRALALFIAETPLLGFPGRNGLRSFGRGLGTPAALGGPQAFIPAKTGPGKLLPVFASAVALPDGRFLVTAPTDGGLDYDIYVKAGAADPLVPLYRRQGSAELDAVPLLSRDLPPIIFDEAADRLVDEVPRTLDEAFEKGGSFTFLCENIHFNGPVDLPIVNAPPVGKKLAIEFFTSPQRTAVKVADLPILIQRLDIDADGKIFADLPAGVPLFEVLRRPDGTIPVGRDGQIFHVGGLNFGRAGQTARCVGCHAGHSLLEMPADPAWTNLAPSAVVTADSLLVVEGTAFQPEALVDRRTDPRISDWAAAPKTDATLKLRWNVPLRAQKLVLHGPQPGDGHFGSRNQVIWAFQVTTHLRGVRREERVVRQEIPSRVLSVRLNPALEFDVLTLTIKAGDVSGLFEGRKSTALAEIEVIAQVAGGSSRPTVAFLRGDSNCDGKVEVSDAANVLISLFLGGGPLCCNAAADVNIDGAHDVTDVIHLLDHLFQGGAPPEAPFPDCGPMPEGALGCEQEVCP